nr:MAG: hypothetical protein [Microviridae sp.]
MLLSFTLNVIVFYTLFLISCSLLLTMMLTFLNLRLVKLLVSMRFVFIRKVVKARLFIFMKRFLPRLLFLIFQRSCFKQLLFSRLVHSNIEFQLSDFLILLPCGEHSSHHLAA